MGSRRSASPCTPRGRPQPTHIAEGRVRQNDLEGEGTEEHEWKGFCPKRLGKKKKRMTITDKAKREKSRKKGKSRETPV